MTLVSIIIDNYNYGQFLALAIDSALAQTHRPLEVIVVDDGSTDHSRDVIASYGDQVIAVLKPNGGQASAFNAGFARSSGEVVIFLDADDLLEPGIAARAAAALAAGEGVAKVQYRLALIDGAGNATGALKPPATQRLPNGDLRRHVLTFPDDVAWLPTSGNAFPAWVLRRILPMPESVYRICADYYLLNMPPLFGPIVSLDVVGGAYRTHQGNNYYSAGLDLRQTRTIIGLTCETHRWIGSFAKSLGLTDRFPAPNDVPAVTFAAHRLVSLKLDPAQHPIPGDRAGALLRLGVRAALGRFDLPWHLRLAYVGWFTALAAAPAPLAKKLAELLFHR